MESSAPAREHGESRAAARRRWWIGLAKMAFGVALLAALIYWGQIDLAVLWELTAAPSAVLACATLLILAIPVAALRWSILLRALGVSLPFVSLFHFVAIAVLGNVLLLGNLGSDAIRGIYAWRELGRSGGRVAVSIVADRIFGLLAVLFISLVFMLLYWPRMQHVPALAALGTSIFAAAAACVIGIGVLFIAPGLVRPLEAWLRRWPFAARMFAQVREVILLLRTRPLSLLAAFALALATQVLTAMAVILIAQAIKIGSMTAADYMFAVPLTITVNSIPITPSGIGVGEVAFDQICRWLEPVASGAAYSSVFFAFRIVGTLTCIPGLISLAVYRKTARPDASG